MAAKSKKKSNIIWWISGGVGLLILSALTNRARVMSNLSKVKLGANFALNEFVVTSTGIENIPDQAAINNLQALVTNVLQPLRTYLGKSISITSGFRSKAVNEAIGGSSATSQHMLGQAADFHVDGMTNQQIIDAIRKLNLPYDQVIDEQLKGKKWVHVSYKPGGRKQWLTARDKQGGGTLYTTVQYG